MMQKIVLRMLLLSAAAVLVRVPGIHAEPEESIEFIGNEVLIPQKLGDIKLYKDSDGFYISKNGQVHNVRNCYCDPLLRRMSYEQLMTFLGRDRPQIIMLSREEASKIKKDDLIEIKGEAREALINKVRSSGYIVVSQMSDGEYRLEAKVRLVGGGWWDVGCKIFIGAAVGATVGAGLAYNYKIPDVGCCAIGGAIIGVVVVVVILIYDELSNSGSSNNRESTSGRPAAQAAASQAAHERKGTSGGSTAEAPTERGASQPGQVREERRRQARVLPELYDPFDNAANNSSAASSSSYRSYSVASDSFAA